MKYTLILLLFISQIAFAQINSLNGYVIFKNQSDTTKGKIGYLNWSENPDKIQFKSINADYKEISVSELKAFGIYEKENYIIKKVDLDETPFSDDNLRQNRQMLIKKDTTLALLVLLQAKHSLFYLKDANEKEHFFIDELGQTKELINHKFMVERNSKTYQFEDKQYINQLDLLFSSCNNSISTTKLAYETNALTEKMIKFNDCMGCKYTCYLKKKDDKMFNTFEILGGINTELIKHIYLSGALNNTTRSRIPTSGFNIGASYSIHSKRDNGNKIARFEVLYENLFVKSKLYDYTVNLPFFDINILYRRISNINHMVYGFGANVQIYLGNTNNKVGEFYNAYDIVNYKPHFIADLGFSKNKFEVFLRTRLTFVQSEVIYLNQYPTNISSFENGYFSNIKFQLLCSYSLNRKRKLL